MDDYWNQQTEDYPAKVRWIMMEAGSEVCTIGLVGHPNKASDLARRIFSSVLAGRPWRIVHIHVLNDWTKLPSETEIEVTGEREPGVETEVFFGRPR